MSHNEMLKPGVYYLQGAHACLEGAIMAGCRVYAGYPITPATEIMEHAAHRLPRVGGRFIQMEDEISSASVLLGASWAGAKAMTATSSPGFSLMQEVISFAIMTETPLVIVDVQRPGPGQGYITTGQEDVMQARWGHHGEGSIIALAPASVQDMFEFTIEAFNLAERWRTPVLVMAEETVAHMRERLIVPPLDTIPIVNRTKPQDMGIAPEHYLPYGHAQVPPMATWGEGYNINHVSLVHHEDGNVTRYNPKVHFENVARIHRKIEDNVDGDRPDRDPGTGGVPPRAHLLRFGVAHRDRGGAHGPHGARYPHRVHSPAYPVAVSRAAAASPFARRGRRLRSGDESRDDDASDHGGAAGPLPAGGLDSQPRQPAFARNDSRTDLRGAPMKKHPMLKYLKEEGPAGPRLPLIMCPGCGAGQVLNYALHAVDTILLEDDLRKEDFVFISGVGCSSRLASHYLNFDSAWTLHGRALSVATGALLANPRLKVVVFTGDGDAAAIGGNHFIHTCRRNMDMTILCMNNGLYGMTGGQVAPTTPIGKNTTTTPYGNVEDEFDLCRLAQTAGATYVARWTTAHPHQVIKSIIKGIRTKGTAFIEILSQCPVHLKTSPVEMFRNMKKITVPLKKSAAGALAGKIPVGEFCNIDKPDWIERYQKIMDQFSE